MTAMLNFVYDRNNFEQETSNPSVANAIRCIELYRVADKYMVPKLQAMLPETFQNKLQDWLLDWATKSPDLLTAGFSEIVSALYTLPETDQCHEMVQALMKAIDRVHLLRNFQNGGYQPPPLLMNTAKAVAEFGRDLFLYVIDETIAKVKPIQRPGWSAGTQHNAIELSVPVLVSCQSCYNLWRRTIPRRQGHPVKGHCIMCGKFDEDWTKCEVWVDD
jgi:hypothetical protein